MRKKAAQEPLQGFTKPDFTHESQTNQQDADREQPDENGCVQVASEIG